MKLGFDLQENVTLAPLTTIGVGGAARWFVEAGGEGQLQEVVRWARRRQVPAFVLGGGSNLLVSDAGFDGLVIHTAIKGVATDSGLDETGCRIFHVAAGEDWDPFVDRAIAENCAGIECLAGIPGWVGGTPVQNVGAYGQEVSETIRAVRVLDLESMEFAEFSAVDCAFSYRSSIFNSTQRGRYVVTRVDFALQPGGPAKLRYADLLRAFPAGSNPSLQEIAAAVRAIRRTKGMLLVEGDPDCRSAGSFFKNPIVSRSQFALLGERLGKEPPHYTGGNGEGGEEMVKLPAAWLIEQAGFCKGFVRGRAGISSRHTLALINRGGATAVDLLALKDEIVTEVEGRFGIHLQMEPVLLGF